MQQAISTIAMSAYNMLAVLGRPVTPSELHQVVSNMYGEEIPKPAFVEATMELVKRKYIRELPGTLLASKDEHRRRVRWRDRTGDGWGNWLVEDSRGPQKLEEVINVHTS